MVGIRREDKSRWEARVPLVPDDVRRLVRDHGLKLYVQRSPIRAFRDEEYEAAGAELVDDLAAARLILGVKEIPPQSLEPGKVYVYFAHVIKGQPHNMPALKRLLELGCTLIDYEKITDAQGRRLVFFGRYAGLAGMIDTLWALGKRLEHEGVANPFSQVRQAYSYRDLAQAQAAIASVAEAIRRNGLPRSICPFVCGFAGYGHVSQGAQEIYDLLPVREVRPEDLPGLPPATDTCYKVVFREEHMVERIDSSRPFDLQEYYEHPERYRSIFFRHVPYLTVLVNGIYWDARYPRLLTREQLRELYAGGPPRLRVIGDISCDLDGSVQCTQRTTEPSDPVYVYDPQTGQTRSGVEGTGPVVLAVDFLPCELPVDASTYFSRVLTPFVAAMGKADFSAPLERSGLPDELVRAAIVWQGQLTLPYRYLERFLPSSS